MFIYQASMLHTYFFSVPFLKVKQNLYGITLLLVYPSVCQDSVSREHVKVECGRGKRSVFAYVWVCYVCT